MRTETEKTQLWLKPSNMDVTGGNIQIEEIDRLAEFPHIKSVTISGLNQETFEYFITKYGKQLHYIEFFKNKKVNNWELLGTLPELECVEWFHNQRITALWDMSKNYALKVLSINDFTRLHSIDGIEKAPALEWFDFGNAVCATSEIESLSPLCNTNIRRIDFYGKKIKDFDISVLSKMKNLEIFNFPTNLFTTEQVAWIVANFPDLKGYSLRPYVEFVNKMNETEIPTVIIVGKRKPAMVIKGNEKRIENYTEKFHAMVKEMSMRAVENAKV